MGGSGFPYMRAGLIALTTVLLVGLVAGKDAALGQNAHKELFRAAEAGDRKSVERLLKKGMDVNARRPGDRSTALILACNKGQYSVVRLLVEKGADVNTRNVNGWTPLMGAASSGDIKSVELLLAHKADVNAKHAYGWSALKLAKKKGHKRVERVLRRFGAGN